MGALFSKPKKIEAKAIRTYEKLENTINKCKTKKRYLNMLISISHFLFLIFFALECVAFYFYRLNDITKLKFIFCGFAVIYGFVRFLLVSIIENQVKKLEEKIIELKYKFEKYFNQYKNSPEYQRAKKVLQRNGNFVEIDLDSVLNFDFQSVTEINKHKLVTRVLEAITRNGPDNRYALICPACHSYNGTVDPSQKDCQKYYCKYCGSLVSFSDVLEIPKEEETIHTIDVGDQKKIESLSDSDDDEGLKDL